MKKVCLVSIDGMRPDGLLACGNPYVAELEKKCSYTYNAKSAYPSVTLPCHITMMHSVSPQRHGILTNTYVPQVRPVPGIFEKLHVAGATCAMFYGWEPLRDVSRPESLDFATYIEAYKLESVDTVLTDEAIRVMESYSPDFVFLYMVDTDEKGGHDNGWMSGEYLRRISIAIDNVKRAIERFGDEYEFIIVADHGGHDRGHGADIPEDMIIPMFLCGESFAPGRVIEDASLLDVAPTIAEIMGVAPDSAWEGKSLTGG